MVPAASGEFPSASSNALSWTPKTPAVSAKAPAQALTEFSWEGKAAVLEFENKMARPVAERAAFEVLKGRVGA
jgi:hypothetical protein